MLLFFFIFQSLMSCGYALCDCIPSAVIFAVTVFLASVLFLALSFPRILLR